MTRTDEWAVVWYTSLERELGFLTGEDWTDRLDEFADVETLEELRLGWGLVPAAAATRLMELEW
jgi:hypothetical protein